MRAHLRLWIRPEQVTHWTWWIEEKGVKIYIFLFHKAQLPISNFRSLLNKEFNSTGVRRLSVPVNLSKVF